MIRCKISRVETDIWYMSDFSAINWFCYLTFIKSLDVKMMKMLLKTLTIDTLD